VVARLDGFALSLTGPFSIDVEKGATELELELLEGGVLEGRAVGAVAQTIEGRTIIAADANGLVHSATTSADGRFRIEHVSPGTWNVAAPPRVTGGEHRAQSVVVTNAATTVIDVPLFDGVAAQLRARLTLDGAAARRWRASLVAPTVPPREMASAILDDVGDFSFATVAPGAYSLQLLDDERGPGDLWIAVPLRLEGGANEFALDIALGRVQGRVTSGSAQGLIWRWQRDDGVWASGTLEVDADGSFVVPRMPAGSIQFARMSEHAETPLKRIQLPAHATLDLEL
jgi:hypothetical protein